MGTCLCLFGIVGICLFAFDNLDCIFIDLVEIIRRMRDLIPLDV